jgi:RNA polymerase sigma-70 factor (ECF subfamily)
MCGRSWQHPQVDLLQYYEELLETWTHRLGNREDAADITHDVIVRILQAGPTIQNLRAYLHQMARNLATDSYRHNAIHEIVPLETVQDRATSTDYVEAAAQASEIAGALELALTELPLRCRQAFIWQRIDGLTRAEIAVRLGVSTRMIQKYLNRATRHLRARMAEFE